MGVNKVEFGGNTLIDLTSDSVTPETLAEGVTAHDKSGAVIVGTMKSGEDLNAILTEQEALIDELKATLRGKIAGGAEDLEAVLLEQEALIEELKAVLYGKLNGL